MPSFKKRVHSQRIPQRERPAVTPYEGAYDEKYSSDEENVEYDVCEPEDLTERSNSTVTFSEDIYDSDTIDEMIRNQIRKPSQVSQEGHGRSEDLLDGSKPSKSILKDGKGRGSKKDRPAPGPGDVQPPPSQSKVTVSAPEKISEGEVAEGDTKTPESAAAVDKKDEKGEEITKSLQGITDTVTETEPSMKGEREIVTKTLQSTIPLQIDQITDSSATNKHDFAENSEKLLDNVTKPPQVTAVTHAKALAEVVVQESALTDGITKEGKTPSADAQQKTSPAKASAEGSYDKELIIPQKVLQGGKLAEHTLPDKILETSTEADAVKQLEFKEEESEPALPEEDLENAVTIPTREDATKTAMELLEDITKTVQTVFPEIPDGEPENIQKSEWKEKIVGDLKFQDGGTQELGDVILGDARQPSKPSFGFESSTSLAEELPSEKIVEINSDISKPEEILNAAQNTQEKIAESKTQFVTEKAVESQQDVKKDEKVKSEVPSLGGKIANGVTKREDNLQDIHTSTADVMPKLPPAFTTDSTSTTTQSKNDSAETHAKQVDIVILEKSDKSSSSDSGGAEVTETTTAKPEEQKVEKNLQESVSETGEEAKEDLKMEAESKPRVIFRIDSEDDLQSDADGEIFPRSDPSSPTKQLTEKAKRDLKESLERDKLVIEEKLTKGGIFDITNESLSKTKELVDERLRKISEVKLPAEVEEPVKKDKSPVRTEMIKIGRFHITPALVEEVISRTKEHEIAERLKMTRAGDETHDEVEKELPEKLTEADLEEVIRELKKEGLKTDVYLQPEDSEREEKREKTLKRVERRFERMASETLEKDIEEEGVSEEKLNEKREIEFQRMVSNLSSEEVAEYQQEYLQLWEEGGLSSLTPTDDWESRDPDTPENELDDDSPKKSESFRGSHGTGETGEPTMSSEPKKVLKSPISPPKPPTISSDISPKGHQQPLTPVDLSHVGSSPSEIDQSSGFVSERSDDIPTYGERKKFWEQMSSSQSSETASELPRSMAESVSSVESVEIDKTHREETHDKISVKSAKQKFEKDVPEFRKPDEMGLVKSLTESYSKKIAAGEIVMPAIPRPKSSASKESLSYETERTDTHKLPDSSDTAVVSELEVKLKSRQPGAPITEETVVSGSTQLEERSKEFEKESKTVVPLSERKKVFESSFQEQDLIPKLARDRSMSLPTTEVPGGLKMKKKHIKDEMRKEMIIEQMISGEERTKEITEKKLTPEIEEAATIAMTELLSKGVKIAEEALRNKEKTVIEESVKITENVQETVKESHLEKSETEDTEKGKPKKPKKMEEDFIPSILVTTTGRRQPETASIGESEDTQSESDVTPEEARMVDNGDGQWDGSGTQSGGFSPKDDIDYPKEVRETGIGRWIGQEDLSKQLWEKEDIDSSHFKIQTKWERTRSEGASPKEHYVCTPEEHYPDTVWEVPVQEQLEKEEITHDIPIEKQVIIEKDEEEDEEDEDGRTKLTEEEAKEIAEEILEYIQFEVENRSSFLVDDDETPEGISQAKVTDYLRHLTGGKEFDEHDVQLIESILVKKQKTQMWKSQSVDTTVCSADITDEELRSTGIDNDISPVESQITKLGNLEEEYTVNDSVTEEARRLKDVEIVDRALAEVKESLEAAQEQLIEEHKKKSEIIKKESPSEFEFKGINYDRKITEAITEQSSEWEKLQETTSEKSKTENKKTEEKVLVKEHFETAKAVEITGDERSEKTTEEFLKESTKMSHEEELIMTETEKLEKALTDEEKTSVESREIKSTTETEEGFKTDRQALEKTNFDKTTKKAEKVLEKVEEDGKTKEHFGLRTEDREIQQMKEKEIVAEDSVIERSDEKIRRSAVEEKEEIRDSLLEIGKTETQTIEEDGTSKSTKTEILKSDSKFQKSVISETKETEFKNLEVNVPETTRKIGEKLYSSEDSPRSTSLEDSIKSPPGGDEMLSSTSSTDKQGEKLDVVFRHSSSGFLKADRRSGADLEPYSSSGESYYHSFEQTSSRPCSSDVEALLAGNVATTGSSEYESAMSHDISSRHPTSTDYQTAVSSLSSRESIKSLDSESSGHLASVEVSSEASETLIPSALELDKDLEVPGVLDDDGLDFARGRSAYRTQMSAPETVSRPVDEDFEIISESEVASWTGGVSDDEVLIAGEEVSEENAQKMKRSHEMTFQPEPKPIVFSESLDGFSRDGVVEKLPLGSVTDENSSIVSAPEERLASSLEESGSVLSMSLSTTSEPSAIRTVIELSHTDSEKMDGSLTVSATSIDSASREDLETTQLQTNEMSTSTATSGVRKKTESVTITTSSSDIHGVPCVSTQVTSVSRKSSMADEAKSDSESHDLSAKPIDLSHANGPTQVEYVADYDEIETTKTKKTQGHRRKESTSNFVPTIMWNLSEARTQKLGADITETEEEYNSNKYVYDVTLTEKEVKNDEKKEADDLESFEGSEERKPSEGDDEFKDLDNNRPQSQISRTDSDSGRRPVSSVFSEDQADSELSELMKQGSSETEREDPLERPLSPEPEEMENKDITPEFSSEAQASVTELEMEYSGAYSRRDEYASHVSPIREERSDARFKEAFEENVEVEKVPDGLHSQTSLESTIAEKHELETGEKEILQKKGDLPDITVTEHVTPVSHQKFQYPEPKEEAKERKSASKTPDTPASTSSRTSSSSIDGKEYNLDEVEIKKIPKDVLMEEKEVNETKDEKESLDSPSSDSFEMLDKPDISDEFVIIEEVGREAQENDQEGKSIEIKTQKKKLPKRVKQEQDVILSPPAPATKMTDLRYYPSEEDADLFSFDSESPPQPTTRKFVDKLRKRPSKEEKDELEYDQQIEENKKWLETQFQGEQAAKIMGAYGYEMEFERAPLEDIKEEDLNELDSSSKIGSMGSQKESLGSFGSVKDSFSSTPDYDVLAGRKYFTRSGDHDDVSMSSLQEFELIEKKLMENGKKSGSSSSQDSLSSKKLGTSSKSGQGDDFSTGSLKEFETLENACATVVNMEKKAKQEEAILTEIDEGHESQISESESCETVSAVSRQKVEFDTEDFDKKMFEIDEIIRQAQSNVEKFSEMQALEKIESIGRGDSYEEVAKVPDLELDMPLSGKSTDGSKHGKGGYPSYSTQVVTKKKVEEWRAAEKTEKEKSPKKPKESPKQSELLENGGKIKSVSADSLEIQAAEKQIIQEGKEETISLDSYRRKPQKTDGYGFCEITHKSDSLEEVSRHHDSSDYISSGTDHAFRPPPRADFMLGSTDSLDPSSSTATHATYQYETDSVMSSSFTSGDSNTMVSSNDNLDLLVSGQSALDFSKGISRTDDWLENLEVGCANPFDRKKSELHKVSFKGPDADRQMQEYLENLPQEEVVETEEVDEHGNVHIKKILKQRVVIRGAEPRKDFHKRTEMAPEVQKIVFTGPDAEQELQRHLENLDLSDDVQEIEEVDEHGNIHVKKIIRQKVLVKPGETQLDVQKISVRGEHPEKTLKTFAESLKDEVTETEEVGEDGTVRIKRVLKQKVVVRPEDLKPEEIAAYERQSQKFEIIDVGPEAQKITFKGPNAEEQMQAFIQQQQQQPEVEEVEEMDEYGNLHVKKVLRERVVIRPGRELTKDELEEYLNKLEEPERAESDTGRQPDIQKVTFTGPDAEKQLQEYLKQQQQPEIEEIQEVDEHGNTHIKKILRQRIVLRPDGGIVETSKGVTLPSEIQRITFKGPDAERQLEEFMQQQQHPEVEEVEEMDEYGNLHVKKVLRERVVIRPGGELTKEELEEYLNKLEEPERAAGRQPDVQKVTFTGPGAEKQLQEYIKQQQQPEIEEVEEVDEHGNIHIKKILRQQIIVRSDDGLREKGESIQKSTMSPEIQKITFKGPDADRQLEEFLRQQQKPEIEEIEEVDEHGNVHVKRIIKQRIVARAQQTPGEESYLLTEDEFQQRLHNLNQTDGEEGGKRVYSPPKELSERLLSEDEFQKRLEQQQTTFHSENVYIGSTAPFVSEVVEPLHEEGFSHIIHRKVQMAPEVQKVVFRGPKADEALKAYVEALNPGEDFEEVEEVDEDGNVHVKRVLRRKIVLDPEDVEKTGLTGEELKAYLKQFEFEYFETGEGHHARTPNPDTSPNNILTQGFSSSVVLTEKDGRSEEGKPELEPSSAVRKESGISQRPPLVSDISMDDEAEYDTTEHDWRHQLEILHAEADEEEIEQSLDAALAGSYESQKKN